MKHTGDYELDEINMLEQECADLEEENRRLEEENKNLKLIQETNEKQIQNDIKERDELREENKKLKEDIKKWEDRWMVKLAEIYVIPTRELTTAIAKNERFSSWYDTVKRKMLHELGFDRLDVQDLLEENKKLKEENQTLELRLDNKEKLNEEYRNQIDLLKCQSLGPSELADSLYDADKTIKNLNDRVKELIGKIDQLEEENENLRKDLFHLTNDGQRKNPTATQGAEGVIREGEEEQGKNARDS